MFDLALKLVARLIEINNGDVIVRCWTGHRGLRSIAGDCPGTGPLRARRVRRLFGEAHRASIGTVDSAVGARIRVKNDAACREFNRGKTACSCAWISRSRFVGRRV